MATQLPSKVETIKSLPSSSVPDSITRHGKPLRCLLVGYNGAGNTGSDIRLLTAIDDIREALGPQTHITVTSINPERTAAILPQGQGIDVEEVIFTPHRFIPKMWKLTRSHDITFLVEGSTFKQNWSPWLLHAYLWAAEYARLNGNYAVAYAVDVGDLQRFHAFWTRRIVERMSLTITRTDVARQRLVNLGIRTPVLATTDTAFRFERQPERISQTRPVVGLAPIEFYQWPIRVKLFCPADERYKWPLAFTWTAERRELSDKMVERWVNLARHAIKTHDVDLQLIAMEDLDTVVCEKIQKALGPSLSERVKISSAQNVAPSEMVGILRGLDALITSRYHACVLSMGGSVPQMAVSHDERLASIYAELGIEQDYLLDYRQNDLSQELISKFDRLMQSRTEISHQIREMHDSQFVPRCALNKEELRAWALRTFDASTANE
jgi:polysaccharide pyruvyl transferase WcaK-like protein